MPTHRNFRNAGVTPEFPECRRVGVVPHLGNFQPYLGIPVTATELPVTNNQVPCWSDRKLLTYESLCRGWCSGPCFRQVAAFLWPDTKGGRSVQESPTNTCIRGGLWWCRMTWEAMPPSRNVTHLVTSAWPIVRYSTPFSRQSNLIGNTNNKIWKLWY